MCCGWMNTFSDCYFFTGILLEKSFDFSEWTPPSRSSPKQSGVREEKDWLSRNSVELRYTVKKAHFLKSIWRTAANNTLRYVFLDCHHKLILTHILSWTLIQWSLPIKKIVIISFARHGICLVHRNRGEKIDITLKNTKLSHTEGSRKTKWFVMLGWLKLARP